MSTHPYSAPKHTNRLSGATSPYLRQHAHNPVDWYPWGEEAFARAAESGKPIFLSIGYSACHWCHVLAHESFEDEATAQLLNDSFVSIKVDREERPDIDRIYQIAHAMLTQRSGGWPLSMFLTHDNHHPFFGGTYFPKEARHGLPAFNDVVQRVAEYYREHRDELHTQGAALMNAFADLASPPAPADAPLTGQPIQAARAHLERAFDSRNGGFGGPPKFPHPQRLERLMRDAQASLRTEDPDAQALAMAAVTLQKMAAGGLNDHLGGGFHRYSTDERWMIPHFEKMLYDNGALLATYADTALATGDPFFARTAHLTADWALREMQAPSGGFYSSLDADSQGDEGRFYVWDREEVRAALTAEEWGELAPFHGLDGPPNFQEPQSGQGRWHLYIAQPKRLAEVDRPLLMSARAKLLALRGTRPRPGLDDKILTAWNALMIRGLAVAARALGRADLEHQATRALDFVRGTLWRDGRLLATCRDGHAHLNAYLDDYAFLADAILELQQVRFRGQELAFAQELMEVVLERFEDQESGGFYFTSDDHEALIYRSKSFADEATPSGNGIAAFVLQRLGHLLGEARYLAAAERTLRAAWPALTRYPEEHASLLTTLEELLSPPQIVILRGDAEEMETWRAELAKRYRPTCIVLAIPADASPLPAALAEKAPRGKTVAYVCCGSTCSAPVGSLSDLSLALQGPEQDLEE